ncbi:MAG: sigma-54-dependent Fis family transcriptional regulator [Gammaproteobacteria bacterium]|nr:sigma-54-dependent Fis family transcriptional regulator [Gammaproteobacteria bacterium]
MSAAHILVVDDETDIRELVKEILVDEGYEVSVADSGEEACQQLRLRRPNLILLDIWMPGIDGISLLKQWVEDGGLSAPVIIMSGHGSVETAVEATRLGAYDFIEKPLSLSKLLVTVKRALELEKLNQESASLRKHLQPLNEPLGKSVLMQTLREQAKRIAKHSAWVLINGEAGSGKELLARYIHSSSTRHDGPFIDLSVAALDRENAAAELFGSEHDGKIRYGWLERANGGTLFLDEIGDMHLSIQGKLLSTLESGSFHRVDGMEAVKLDLRIIAATHMDLEQAVKQQRFREDLFYRLNVVPLTVPALKARCEDIPELLDYYVDQFVSQENLPYRRFSVAAQNCLRNYTWPGNVRELKNLVQRLLILSTDTVIECDAVERALGEQPHMSKNASADAGCSFDLPLREAREQFERQYLEHQLRAVGGSVGKAAKLAGMERTHLYRKLRALGIDSKQLAAEK